MVADIKNVINKNPEIIPKVKKNKYMRMKKA